MLQAVGSFGLALVLSLIYEWRVGLVALAFVPLLLIVLYQEGRMVTAESFSTAKTMQASSKVNLNHDMLSFSLECLPQIITRRLFIQILFLFISMCVYVRRSIVITYPCGVKVYVVNLYVDLAYNYIQNRTITYTREQPN